MELLDKRAWLEEHGTVVLANDRVPECGSFFVTNNGSIYNTHESDVYASLYAMVKTLLRHECVDC